MKAIKLIATFVIILGGVIGAFYLITPNPPATLPPAPDTTYQAFREQFEKDWEQAGDWDERLFLQHCDLVEQLSTRYETATLKDLNTQTATEVVYKMVFDEWHSLLCDKDVVEKYIKAVQVIESKDPNAATDPNIQKIKGVYLTYISAHNLANRPLGTLPHFDGESWESYSDYSKTISAEKDAILDDANYKTYLSRIVVIKKGLEDIPNKLSKGKARFYDELSNQIIEHFSRFSIDERAWPELDDLKEIKSAYESEYMSNSRLTKFVEDYDNDVRNNKNKDR